MARQFPQSANRYGAPMGRHSAPDLNLQRRSIRLFSVRLDNGGYDDGGAYWGFRPTGLRLWCAIDNEGDMQFTDAWSRSAAALSLGIPPCALVRSLDEWPDYYFALLDGRAPMPAGVDRHDVIAYQNLNVTVSREPRA